MRRLPTVLASTSALAAFAVAGCGRPGVDTPAQPPGSPVGTSATPRVPGETPPLDPSLGPRPRAGSTDGPSTTLSPGPGLPAGVDCGTFPLGQVGTLPDSAARCFVDAAQAGHPARLAVTRSSAEGDPIPVTYTAGADGFTRVVTDYRRDAYGPRNVIEQTCQGPSPTARSIEFTKCTQPTPATS